MTVDNEKDIIDNTFSPYAEIDLFSVDGKNHMLDTLLCRFEVKDYEGFFEKIKKCNNLYLLLSKLEMYLFQY